MASFRENPTFEVAGNRRAICRHGLTVAFLADNRSDGARTVATSGTHGCKGAASDRLILLLLREALRCLDEDLAPERLDVQCAGLQIALHDVVLKSGRE